MLKFIKQIAGTLIAFFWMTLFASTAAAAVNVNDFRIGNQSDGVRVVFDMNQSVNYRVFLLDNPKRLVIDLDNTAINKVSEQRAALGSVQNRLEHTIAATPMK